MGVSNLILPKPLVLVQTGGSNQGGVPANSPIDFGTIAKIYSTSDLYVAGQVVCYITTGQIDVIYDNVKYAFIEEDKILANEGVPV